MLEAVWLIPAFPLVGFLTLMVVGRRVGEPMAGWLATAAMGGSFASAIVVFIGLLGESGEERRYVQTLFEWVPAGNFQADIGFLVDPLSVTMTLFVTGVATLIHLYSIGYMHGDPHFSKFFIYLNMFAFSMLMLVLGDNLLLTFLGWEGVGACSYFLISFWFTSEANASAGKKAFVTNRIGDWGFMVATFLTFTAIGSIQYLDIFGNASQMSETTATAVALLLFVGAAGKSAQMPLYIWLPDAMAGPTPVSALIHAATMVTSGVYLLARANPILAEAADWVPTTIAWVGAFTALFAATIAVAQNDIKKVLAYSTVSQLGYMILAVGTGAYVAAIFHMITHAFFKALLFLGSGSVIHGMHHDQDMRHYGALRKLLPITSATFIIGWLAIAGVPPFAGFWSKDEILAYAYNESPLLWFVGLVTALLTAFYMSRQVFLTFFGRYRYADVRPEEIDETWESKLAAARTEFADARAGSEKADDGVDKAQGKLDKANEKLAQRQTEFDEADDDGREKAQKNLDKALEGVTKASEALDESTTERDKVMAMVGEAKARLETTTAAPKPVVPAVALFSEPALDGVDPDDLPESVRERREFHPHESPWQMTFPLVVLAGLAMIAGLLNLPFSSDLHFLGHWLEPSLFGNEVHLELSGSTQWILAIISVVMGLIGIFIAFTIYIRGKVDPAKVEPSILANGWFYDSTITNFMGGPGYKLFDAVAWFDKNIIDGAVNGAGTLVRFVAGRARHLQNGLVRSYAVGIAAGAVLLVAWFLTRASF